jgi:hypothetical protein
MADLRTLVNNCGPVEAVEDASPEAIARAVAEGRAMRIVDEIPRGLTMAVGPDARPDFLFAKVVPPALARVDEGGWMSRRDVAWSVRNEPAASYPPAFVAIDVAEQVAIVDALRAIARRLGDEDRRREMGDEYGRPAFDVLGCEGNAAHRVIRVVIDNMVAHSAQSGSDWYDHCVYVGTVVCAHGKVVSESLVRETCNVSEHDVGSFDRAAMRRVGAG